MTIHQLFIILHARFLNLIISFCLIFGIGIIYVIKTPKTYTATNSVVVDFTQIDPQTGLSTPAQMVSGYMSTQIDIITSHNVALKVVEKLKLIERPENADLLKAITEELNPKDWLADQLIGMVEVKPSKDSNVINISCSGKDPKFLAEVANAFAAAYIQTSLELKVEPATTQAAWFDQQSLGLRDALEAAQRRLSEYQQDTGMVAPDEKLDLESSRLAELSSQLVKAQDETYVSETKREQIAEASAKGHLEELSAIQGNGMIQNLKSELARSEAKLAEIAEGLSDNYPQIQRLRAQIDSLKKKISEEIRVSTGSIISMAAQSKMREVEIERAFAEQKSHVLELKKQHDKINLLKREVENAQISYNTARQRTEKIRLESQRNQTEIAVLNPAVIPVKYSKPKKAMIVSISGVLGVLIGIGVAILTEAFDRRVRLEADIEEMFSIPVLVSLTVQPGISKLSWGNRLLELIKTSH